MEFRREEILPAVYLTALRSDKFKTATLSLSLLTQLDADTASMNALIPSVLRRGTVRCPDMDSLARDFGETKKVLSSRLYRIRRGLRDYLKKEGIAV